jgi:hypothetical protein
MFMLAFCVQTTSKLASANGTASERPSGRDERFGRIDHAQATAVFHRQRAGRAAQSTAHVQHAFAGREPAKLRQSSRRAEPAAVKVVDAAQVCVAQRPRDIRAARVERVEYGVQQVAAGGLGVVLGDSLLQRWEFGHARPA